MAESKSEFKPSGKFKEFSLKGFSGSLALRVFLVTIVFLVLPLIFYSGVMYKYDFDLKREQSNLALSLVGEEEMFMIDQLTNFEFRALELLALILKSSELNTPQKINKIFTEVKEFHGVEEVFLLEKKGAGSICSASSDKLRFNKPFNKLFYNKKLKNNEFAVITTQEESLQKAMIYFTRVLKRDANGMVEKTINFSLPTSFVVDYLSSIQGYHKDYSISLIRNDDQIVFDSQDKDLLGAKIYVDQDGSSPNQSQKSVYLDTVPKAENIYEFHMDDQSFYATRVPLAAMNFSVLVTTPKYSHAMFLREYLYKSIILLLFIIIFGCLATLMVTFMMASPLRRLCHVMQRVAERDLSARYETSKYGFEINNVGNFFNIMIEKLIDNVEKIKEYKLEEERLKQELAIARQVQRAILPRKFPDIPGMAFQAGLIPAKEVGGDFYDFIVRADTPDEIAIVIADTAGSGIFGCLHALIFRSTLKSFVSISESLSTAIEKTNSLFYEDANVWSVFVTCWIGYYNYKTKVLKYSSCGHPFGYIFRDGELFKELSTPGMALGVEKTYQPTIDEITIKKNDTLIFITDGIIEAQNPEGELFGKKRFYESVIKNLDKPEYEILENVVCEVQEFEKDLEKQSDDLTMLVVKITD
ncbi:hypothetical protein COB11_02140 [Candidatus Aerophobetes bacterium]|uniref:HAMP domain-containing protein n=1 Tax=Aerophobetes bacterium TaxID=2030807 RepID=A0A2A4YMB3_UNCAE|nr:MAG: hypothetical protein COB11_02140 [Candidatus Aerophobetes bacterium]